jgi:hypothetical protein
MEFEDRDVQVLNPKLQQGLRKVLEFLCGEKLSIGCAQKTPCKNCQACMNWQVLSSRLKLTSLTLEDLNDILLLADQFPLSRDFFDFFFSDGKTEITFDQLTSGVIRFEGFAVMKFGNVRFAYRQMYNLRKPALLNMLGRLGEEEAVLKKRYRGRREPPALPADIPANRTWFLGYIARSAGDKDIATYIAMRVLLKLTDEKALSFLSQQQRELYTPRKKFLEDNATLWKPKFENLSKIATEAELLQKNLKETRIQGWLNTSHYLASDCMDVYVATSMREQWEFEDVHNVVEEVFTNKVIRPLKLRYFDPTQSFLDNRVDKGLVEALMLKRAVCTVYMVQETDTFGKDSELATTLAQGKPVVAFVPQIDLGEFSKTAYQRPLSYLRKRLLQLAAEDKLSLKAMGEVYNFVQKISDFQPLFQIIGDEEQAYVADSKLEGEKKRMCEVLAEGEQKLSNSRAETLQRRHPLSLQVELQSGVANGVLVVRSEKDVAQLLADLLTNGCDFRFDRKREAGVTALIESISDSPFRVITDNPTVTNSFWSRYLSLDGVI